MTTHTERPSRADEYYEPEPAPRARPPYEPEPHFSLAAAVRRHWLLTLLPVVVLLAAGIVAGAKKPPTYSSTATINVGKSDIQTQATPGYLVAAEALASSYSRLVASQNVTLPAARAAGVSPAAAASDLSAVPIPQEPTFTITASGTSAAKATALANAAVNALSHYVNVTATQGGGPSQLLAKYQVAQRQVIALQHRVSRLQNRLNVNQSQLAAAKLAEQTASLKAQGLSSQYLGLSQSGVAPTLAVLVSPTGATATNRITNVEKFGIIGAVAGLVIGIAFAGMAEALGAGRRRRVA
jgi:Chain length determinant protein